MLRDGVPRVAPFARKPLADSTFSPRGRRSRQAPQKRIPQRQTWWPELVRAVVKHRDPVVVSADAVARRTAQTFSVAFASRRRLTRPFHRPTRAFDGDRRGEWSCCVHSWRRRTEGHVHARKSESKNKNKTSTTNDKLTTITSARASPSVLNGPRGSGGRQFVLIVAVRRRHDDGAGRNATPPDRPPARPVAQNESSD